MACQAIIGIHDETGIVVADAGEGGLSADTAPAATCFPKRPPGPPPDERGTGATRIFAINHVSIRPYGRTLGYDLDGLCTTDAGLDLPCRGSLADDPEGVDNAFSNVFIGHLPFADNQGDDPASKAINGDIAEGHQTALIQVKWNGLANDLQTVVFMTQTPGVGLPEPGCDAGPDGGEDAGNAGDAGARFPFRPCDRWTVSALADGFLTSSSATGAEKAWVNGNLLVASFKVLPLNFGTFALAVHDATLTATVSSDGTLTGGLLAGRIIASEAVKGAVSFHYSLERNQPAGGAKPICQQLDGGLIPFIQENLCPARDLTTTPSDPSTACDSISIALGFEAVQVGAVVGTIDAGVDDCPDFDLDAACPPLP